MCHGGGVFIHLISSHFVSPLSRFQKVFDQAVKQEEIFENIARPVADR